MGNKHIKLVKKWLGDPESVTVEELKANYEAAATAADAAYAAAAAEYAARAADAAYATESRTDVVGWINEYEELTGKELRG